MSFHAHPRKGFALLITITLLAFLVLLLVSLASLTRVETQVAGNGMKLAGARSNALMALTLALGQLQKFAGPDQVVSARADVTTAGALVQPYLTGLWKITNPTSTPDVWLVSGNETSPVTKTPANVLDPATGTEPVVDGTNGYVFLVGSNSVSANSQRVRLDKQAITAPASSVPGLAGSPIIGNYAYWVGDEGIKASASLVNPLLAANPIAYDNATGSSVGGVVQGDNWSAEPIKRARLDQVQLARPRLEHLFTAFNPDTDGLTGLPKVKNQSQLLMMTNSPTAAQLKNQFYSLTPLSRAVLADVTNGRLRKDLSDTTASPNPAILKFQQTRLTPSSTGTYDGYYTPVAASNPAANTWPAFSLGPVLTEIGVRLNFYLNSTDNKVHYAYVIDAELWNPYAAQLRLSPSEPLTVEISGLPTFTVKTDGATPNTTLTLPTLTATFDPASTDTTINPANLWKDGRIRMYRGTGTLVQITPAPVPALPYTIFDAVLPGAPVDPAATIVTVTYPATSSFATVLKVNGAVLTNYIPTRLAGAALTYSAGTSTNSGGPVPASSSYIVGYGYEFADSIIAFTSDVGQPVSPSYEAIDPRLPTMKAMFWMDKFGRWDPNGPRKNSISDVATAFIYSSGGNYTHFDLPRQELTSLAMFTHVIGAKSYAIGNTWGGTDNTIFDQYHMSTVPRFSTTWTPESGLPLPNRYATVYHPDNTPAIPLADLRSSANSARYLLQSGAFNINSTSVEAWSAVLGSKFTAWKYQANTGSGIGMDNVFFRLPHGAQQVSQPPLINMVTPTGPTGRNQNPSGTGGRQLTAQEVTDLAAHIVAQIRAHGRPYVSLADFINDGAITRAIATKGTVIDPATGTVTDINSTTATFTSPNRTYTPGALIQSDVIGAITPFMAPRSDTFVIRTYGDAQNPATGTVEGRAWCEATVQRLPDLAENASAPISDVITPNTATYPYGRKFKIISFRWLSPSDI